MISFSIGCLFLDRSQYDTVPHDKFSIFPFLYVFHLDTTFLATDILMEYVTFESRPLSSAPHSPVNLRFRLITLLLYIRSRAVLLYYQIQKSTLLLKRSILT